jgi:hypothetical protein
LATFKKRILSSCSYGQPLYVNVNSSSATGTLLHTAVAGTTAGTYDEIWLFAYNGDSDAQTLTTQIGGTDSSLVNNLICTLASKSGLQLVVPGLILQNGLEVRASAGTTSVITLSGFINQISD